MLRGFRHRLFLLMQTGVLVSALVAWRLWPAAWPAIAVCAAGSILAAFVCDRVARSYLRSTLGRLRRAADELGRGHAATGRLDAHPGDDFYKLVNALNLVAQRLEHAAEHEQRLQEELRRRERLAFLGELAATVAHEVNNPLDGVQSCSRILRRCLDDRPRAAQMVDLIDGGLARIELTVRRLLTLARENVIRPEPAGIASVIEAAIADVAPKLEERGIEIERRFEAADDRAHVDRRLLEQVFVNLLVNAADSMERGGRVTLRVTRERGGAPGADGEGAHDSIRVDVVDGGAGVSPDTLPHIFEPFFTTKQGGRGTGLGLAIAARIVDAHRGTIRVACGEQGGAVFTVRIPAAEDGLPLGAAPARREPRSTPVSASNGRRGA